MLVARVLAQYYSDGVSSHIDWGISVAGVVLLIARTRVALLRSIPCSAQLTAKAVAFVAEALPRGLIYGLEKPGFQPTEKGIEMLWYVITVDGEIDIAGLDEADKRYSARHVKDLEKMGCERIKVRWFATAADSDDWCDRHS